MILVGLAYAQFHVRTLGGDMPKEAVKAALSSVVEPSEVSDAPPPSPESQKILRTSPTGIGDPRLELWSYCLARLAERPWSGGGFGREAFKRSYPEFVKSHAPQPLWHAHNMVLNKGIQMGLPGIGAFLLLWGVALMAVVRGLRQPEIQQWAVALLAMMAAVFLRSMTDDFFIRNHAQMFWLMLGAFLGCSRQLSLAIPGESAR